MEHSLCVLQEHLSDIIISSNARDIAEHHGMTAPTLLHSTYHMLYDISLSLMLLYQHTDSFVTCP